MDGWNDGWEGWGRGNCKELRNLMLFCVHPAIATSHIAHVRTHNTYNRYTITFPYHNSIVVHAGILPDIPLVEQHWSDLTCMRDAIRAVDDPAAAEAAAATTATDDVSNGSASEWVGLEKPRDGSVPWASTWQGSVLAANMK